MNSSTHVNRRAVQGQGRQRHVVVVQLRPARQLVGNLQTQATTVMMIKVARNRIVVMMGAVNHLRRRLTEVDRRLARSRGRSG